jgi:hypothetical protein
LQPERQDDGHTQCDHDFASSHAMLQATDCSRRKFSNINHPRNNHVIGEASRSGEVDKTFAGKIFQEPQVGDLDSNDWIDGPTTHSPDRLLITGRVSCFMVGRTCVLTHAGQVRASPYSTHRAGTRRAFGQLTHARKLSGSSICFTSLH